MKKALITGCSGQDGSYLAQLLLKKGYEVFGLVRRSSNKEQSLQRIKPLLNRMTIIEGDLTDQSSINHAIEESDPHEVYNLGAQSFVSHSWKAPAYTADVTGIGAVRVLEAIRNHNPNIKMFQASSSEMFGNNPNLPLNEDSKFYPRSPYACAKVYAHYATINYRESYGMKACCGISFNHSSPRRGSEFVTKKITEGVAKISLGKAETISLGNLDARRDWGFAKDYVEAYWMMLQAKHPSDYVIATGESHSVREFVVEAFKNIGIKEWHRYVVVEEKYMRPADVPDLVGDASKIRKELGWKPKVKFESLVKIMVEADINRLNP